MNRIPWLVPTFDQVEGDRRFTAIRQAMAAQGLDALIVAGHQGNYGERAGNLRYVSNYAPWYDDEYVVMPASGEPTLLAWSEPHAEWASRVSWIKQIVPAAQMARGPFGKERYPAALAAVITDSGSASGRVGLCDFETMPASIFLGLRKHLPDAEFVEAGRLLADLRMIKSEAELGFMRRSAECGDQGLAAMVETARPGVSESEVWGACEEAMLLAGATPPSFTLMASSSSLAEKGLGMPYAGSGRVLEAGDFILNELTPSYGGYWVQLDSPICLGTIAPDLAALVEVHQEMYDLALSMLAPGVTIGEVNAATREVAERGGSDPQPAWSLAHIGLLIRDDLAPTTVVEEGMTFAVQPFTQHGGGAHGGHTVGTTVAVTADGCEVLNKPPQVYVV